MYRPNRLVVLGLVVTAAGLMVSGSAQLATAEDAFYHVPIDELKITEGELPPITQGRTYDRYRYLLRAYLKPYAVLDRQGDVYINPATKSGLGIRAVKKSTGVVYIVPTGELGNSWSWRGKSLSIRAEKGKDVTGSLYVMKGDKSAMHRVRFVVPADQGKPEHRKTFYQARKHHYQNLANSRIPGGAWYRHQVRESQAALGIKTPNEITIIDGNRRIILPVNRSKLEDTFQVFSGGRALSENLQLDRLLPVTRPEVPTVELASIKGITVKEMDWKELTKGIAPKTDPLATILPADQYVLLFNTFKGMVRMMDEAKLNGTPLLQMVQPRSESARSRQRYERQLCLSVSAFSRLLGHKVVESVAFTGSDPYLRTGTDVAILFQAKKALVLTTYIQTKQEGAIKEVAGCQKVEGTIGDVSYVGAVTPDRSICSYMAQIGDVVVVTNSLVQLRRIADAASGKAESLASLSEYRFFRNRYKRGKDGETGLLIVTDAAIRRWCSPKWRIATSRRTRAAAIMAQYQATHMKALVAGTAQPQLIHTKMHVSDLGTLRLTGKGVTSSTYGTLEFLTPIVELDLTKVTKSESTMYNRWRNGYQRNWSQFFDPIAVRFSVSDKKLFADMTVMPLIASSEYNRFIRITSGVKLKPTSGDPHKGSFAHFAMAVNIKSKQVQSANNFLQFSPYNKAGVLGWLGESVSIYADDDPFWGELAKAVDDKKDESQFLLKNAHRLPVALTAEVSDGLKLALFLTGLRAFVEQTVPSLLEWTALKHDDQPYVRISQSEAGRAQTRSFVSGELSLYYAATPDLFIVTLREDLLQRALDRRADRKKAAAGNKNKEKEKEEVVEKETVKTTARSRKTSDTVDRSWLGESVSVQFDRKVLDLFEVLANDNYQAMMQGRCWSNLAILNEWKRLYADRNPVAVHQNIWQTKLRCPGGGHYVWNEKFRTMESTVYGHPGEPKMGPRTPQALKTARFINFGLTFENQGLRAKVAVERTTSK